MTPRERFEAALALSPVDQPPIMYQHLGAARTVVNAAGMTIRQGFHDPEAFAKIAIMAQRITGFDNVMAGWGDILVEARAHGTKWAWPERDFYPRVEHYAVMDLADIDRIHPVDPMKDEFWSVPLRAAGIMNERVGNDVAVLACLDSPTIIASEVMGLENMLMASVTDPGLIDQLLNVLVESSKAYVEHVSSMGLEIAFVENGSAGLEMNSMENIERFDLQNMKRMVDCFHSHGLKVIAHNCAAMPYLDGYPEIGADAVHFHLTAVDREATFAKLKGRTAVMAGIDHMFLLFKGTPEEVDREVSGIIGSWGDGPGLMMAPGCEMPFKTPVDNIIALREAVARYGRKSLS
jgi:uroporphyrinogen decarboxylase